MSFLDFWLSNSGIVHVPNYVVLLSQFGVSSDILTSCDWSAVIHRPAEESEPEDLPSTVDIDAIKVILVEFHVIDIVV